MAVETKRGCGYRKVGNLYFVTDAEGYVCDRMPIPLTVCPCCGHGVKFSRGFTWIEPTKLLEGDHGEPENQIVKSHSDCNCPSGCPACWPVNVFGVDGRAGLMWVGKKFYTVKDFLKESNELGFSKRIQSVPRDFKVGETWVFLAHVEALEVVTKNDKPENGDVPIQDKLFDREPKKAPGIFMAIKPKRIERIVKQSEFGLWKDLDDMRNQWIQKFGMEAKNNDGQLRWQVALDRWKNMVPKLQLDIMERLDRDVERGITLVPVPDEDRDHAKQSAS